MWQTVSQTETDRDIETDMQAQKNMIADQWRSQGLMEGWAQRVWGTPQQGPRPERRWGLGAKPPEARYAYTICSGQTHFRDVFIEDMRCTFRLMRSLLPPDPTAPKTLHICANLMTRPGWGRWAPMPHRGYATVADYQINSNITNQHVISKSLTSVLTSGQFVISHSFLLLLCISLCSETVS